MNEDLIYTNPLITLENDRSRASSRLLRPFTKGILKKIKCYLKGPKRCYYVETW